MPRFIGIDLAWSGRNPTGLAVLDLDLSVGVAKLLATPTGTIRSDEEILSFVNKWAGNDPTVLVGVDAPLTVPNEFGSRPGEKALNAVFARFQAGAHPANRTRLASYNQGTVRGEILVNHLESLHIHHHPRLETQKATRQVFEIYPHPAMIVMFGLAKTLKYKQRPQISKEHRMQAFEIFAANLRDLHHNIPSLELPESLFLDRPRLESLKGRAVKAYEDQLDAVFCAYIALYYWWWGQQKCHIFGDEEQGYIITPIKGKITVEPAAKYGKIPG